MTGSAAPIVTGLLAYGMSGRVFHAPFLTTHPGFALHGVVERHSPGRMAADYPGTGSYPSVGALLADPRVELVVVNTPNDTHVELARQALRAGKHVLLEKPVAVTTAGLRNLLELSQHTGRALLAFQNRRWDADFGAVRRIVASGVLGRLVEAHFRFDRYRPALNSKRFKEDPARPASGLLYDLGPHLIDQALSLFGPPLSAVKTLARHREGSEVDDYFSLRLRYPAGLNVWLSAGLFVADPGPAYVLHGTHGSYRKERTDPQEAQLLAGMSPLSPAYGRETPGQEGRLTTVAPDGTLTTSFDPAAPGRYQALFEAVYQTIRHGHPYPITADALLGQLRLLELPPSW